MPEHILIGEHMELYMKPLMMFVTTYLAMLIGRAIVAKERDKQTSFEGLKDLTNHKTAGISAFVTIVISFYLNDRGS